MSLTLNSLAMPYYDWISCCLNTIASNSVMTIKDERVNIKTLKQTQNSISEKLQDVETSYSAAQLAAGSDNEYCNASTFGESDRLA